MKLTEISYSDRLQIVEILDRRAFDIETFKFDLEKKTGQKFEQLPGSVEMALSREIKRLRRLAGIVIPVESDKE